MEQKPERFPDGFMFRLTKKETKELVTGCDRFATLKHASTTRETLPPDRLFSLAQNSLFVSGNS